MDVQKSSRLLAVGRWMMLAGLALVLVGGLFGVKEWWWSRHQAHADSVVSEMEARAGGDEIVYFPHFRFRLPDGAVVDAVSKEGSSSPLLKVGDAVPVVYVPANPKDVLKATTWAVYGVGLGLAIGGIAGFDLGVVVWWWGRRRAVKRGEKPGGGQRGQFAGLFGAAGGYRSGERR